MPRNKEFQAIGRIARAVGMQWKPTGAWDRSSVGWDGSVLHGRRKTPTGSRSQKARDLWHELAHWLLAEDDCQGLVGFGGGSPPDRTTPPAYHPMTSRVKEVEASALGILLQLRVTWPGAAAHYQEHCWDGAMDPKWLLKQIKPINLRRVSTRCQQAGLSIYDLIGGEL